MLGLDNFFEMRRLTQEERYQSEETRKEGQLEQMREEFEAGELKVIWPIASPYSLDAGDLLEYIADNDEHNSKFKELTLQLICGDDVGNTMAIFLDEVTGEFLESYLLAWEEGK